MLCVVAVASSYPFLQRFQADSLFMVEIEPCIEPRENSVVIGLTPAGGATCLLDKLPKELPPKELPLLLAIARRNRLLQ